MWKKIIAWGLFAVWGAASAAAQSNDRLDELLAQAQAHLDATSYLLLTASGQVAEDTEVQAAFDAAVSAGLIASSRKPDEGVSVEDLAYLVMKTQKIPGGLEWTFLPSPRAAYRELVYRNVVNASAGPRRLVAGDEVVRTLTAAHALVAGGAP
jgi:hypothetical protein